MFSEHPFWEVDAKFLFEKGKKAFSTREYSDAVHYLEAALQLEMQPFYRHQLLNLLAVCYLRSGDTDSARTIQVCLQEKKEIHMYDVLPERGF
jgi:Flp pilus assembly protein TadD